MISALTQTIQFRSTSILYFPLTLLWCYSASPPFYSPSSPCFILLRPGSGDRATGRAPLEWLLTLELPWSFILWDIPPVPEGGEWRVGAKWRGHRQDGRGQKRDPEPEQCRKNCESPHLPLFQRGHCSRFVSRERLFFHPSSLSPCRLQMELGTDTNCIH